jgi:hypothetical protein
MVAIVGRPIHGTRFAGAIVARSAAGGYRRTATGASAERIEVQQLAVHGLDAIEGFGPI